MSEFFGRAVPVATHLALGVSFRAISLPENFITNGELSSLFPGEARALACTIRRDVECLFRPGIAEASATAREAEVFPETGLCACLSFFVASPLLVSVNIHQSNDRAVDPVVVCVIRPDAQRVLMPVLVNNSALTRARGLDYCA